MISTLIADPVKTEKSSFSYELKLALQKRFGGSGFNKMLDSTDISYLCGLRDAGIEDAKSLMEMIEKFGEIIVSEEF